MLYDLKSRCDGEHERSIYSVLDKLQNRTEQNSKVMIDMPEFLSAQYVFGDTNTAPLDVRRIAMAASSDEARRDLQKPGIHDKSN